MIYLSVRCCCCCFCCYYYFRFCLAGLYHSKSGYVPRKSLKEPFEIAAVRLFYRPDVLPVNHRHRHNSDSGTSNPVLILSSSSLFCQRTFITFLCKHVSVIGCVWQPLINEYDDDDDDDEQPGKLYPFARVIFAPSFWQTAPNVLHTVRREATGTFGQFAAVAAADHLR